MNCQCPFPKKRTLANNVKNRHPALNVFPNKIKCNPQNNRQIAATVFELVCRNKFKTIMNTTIIHISDLHFHTYPQNFRDWKSKRILGAANLLFRRKRQFPLQRAKRLVEQIQKMNWDHLVISGDLTQLALEKGFSRARKTLEPLLTDPERVTVIPGNHDRYVSQAAGTDLFSQYFGEFFGNKEIHVCKLNSDWVIIGWDSAHPNDWLSASGTVRRSTIQATAD